MIKLRDYQQEAVETVIDYLKDNQAALVVAPTGSGKTEIIIELLSRLQGAKILVLLNRIKLTQQTVERFSEANIDASVYCGSLKEKNVGNITIASVHSFYKEASEHKFDYIILDEVHNFAEEDDSSRYYQCLVQAIESKEKIIGFTATPFRAYGTIYGEGKIFEEICFKITLPELINNGYLVNPIVKKTINQLDTSNLRVLAGEWNQQDVDHLVSDTDTCVMQVVETFKLAEGRKKIFWQCANIEHCRIVAQNIAEVFGEPVAMVHSKMSLKDRDENLKEFEEGQVRHCVFVTILSEGYNYPPADCLVLLRPIRSPVLYVQTVGRVLRPYPGKKDALVLDFGQVRETCGPLDGPIVRVKGERNSEVEVTSWICEECFTYNSLDIFECADCGAEKPKKERSTVPKLTQAASDKDFIGFHPIEESLVSVTFSSYKSKSGNDCAVITYNLDTGAVILPTKSDVREYFVKNQIWAIQKFNKRIDALDLENERANIQQVLNNQERRTFNTSKKIQYKKDGKYDRVIRVYD